MDDKEIQKIIKKTQFICELASIVKSLEKASLSIEVNGRYDYPDWDWSGQINSKHPAFSTVISVGSDKEFDMYQQIKIICENHKLNVGLIGTELFGDFNKYRRFMWKVTEKKEE